MKFKDYALAIVFATTLVPPLAVTSENALSASRYTSDDANSRYLNEDQLYKFYVFFVTNLCTK